MSKTLFRSSLALALLMGGAGAAQAQAINDRWEISGSYFRPDVSVTLSGRGTATDGTTSESGAASGRYSDDFNGAHLEGIWRPTQRQRVVAGWYTVGKDRHYGLQESGSYTVPPGTGTDFDGTTVDYAIDGRAKLSTDFDLYRLSYGYDLYQDSRTTVTGLIGAYGAKFRSNVRTSGTAIVNGEAYDLSEGAGVNETRYAPGLGLSAEFRPADKWEVRAGIQGFKTQWGDFDLDGHFFNAQAQVGYRFAQNWTGFVGYDWFDLKLKDDVSGSATVDGVDYTANGAITGRLKVHGPTVGIRARF